MVGILLVTHNGLGDSLIDCVRHVTGKVPANLKSLSVLADDDPKAKEAEGRELIKLLDKGDGVLILTDVYGATPCNIARHLCQPGHVKAWQGSTCRCYCAWHAARNFRYTKWRTVHWKAVAIASCR